MAIFLVCPSCCKRVKVRDTAAGDVVNCPWCKTEVNVPLPDAAIPRQRMSAEQIFPDRPAGQLPEAKYLQSELVLGERLVYTANLHWFIFVRPAFVLVPALLVGAVFQLHSQVTADPKQAEIDTIAAGLSFYVGGITAACQWVIAILRLVFNEFCITNKRVLIREGLVNYHILEIPTGEVTSLNVRWGPFGKRFDQGTILIGGKKGTRLKLRSIQDPEEFCRQVRAVVALAM